MAIASRVVLERDRALVDDTVGADLSTWSRADLP
jgi:hypothetical protein